MAYVCISIESIARSYNCSSTALHKLVPYYCIAFLPLSSCNFSIASMWSSSMLICVLWTAAWRKEKTRSVADDEGLIVKTRRAAACHFGNSPWSFHHLNLSVQSLTSSAATKYPGSSSCNPLIIVSLSSAGIEQSPSRLAADGLSWRALLGQNTHRALNACRTESEKVVILVIESPSEVLQCWPCICLGILK